MWVIGLDAFDARPTLACFIFRGVADRMLGTTPDEAADRVCGMLTEAIGAPCPDPTAVAVTSWATDPYSLGAYSHIPPGPAPADADLLGEPLHGRLLLPENTPRARGWCTPTERWPAASGKQNDSFNEPTSASARRAANPGETSDAN